MGRFVVRKFWVCGLSDQKQDILWSGIFQVGTWSQIAEHVWPYFRPRLKVGRVSLFLELAPQPFCVMEQNQGVLWSGILWGGL